MHFFVYFFHLLFAKTIFIKIFVHSFYLIYILFRIEEYPRWPINSLFLFPLITLFLAQKKKIPIYFHVIFACNIILVYYALILPFRTSSPFLRMDMLLAATISTLVLVYKYPKQRKWIKVSSATIGIYLSFNFLCMLILTIHSYKENIEKGTYWGTQKALIFSTKCSLSAMDEQIIRKHRFSISHSYAEDYDKYEWQYELHSYRRFTQ